MKRKIGSLIATVLLAFSSQVMASEKPIDHRGVPKNILLIVADDLGLQLSCYGDKHIDTPHIDALAASGTRFKTAYVTQASCSPSRTSIFTGLYPHTHGHIGLAKPHNPPLHSAYRSQTLPKILKAAGYRTCLLGKRHMNPKEAFSFDLYLNGELGPNNGREIRAMANAAGEFMNKESEQPFFLVMGYVDPHHPFAAQMDGLPEKPTVRGEVPEWPFQQLDSDTLLHEAANYYNCVRRLDAGVGMLMEELKASGKEENTVIIFLGDHGPPFIRAKTTCYEAGMRVPFIVRWRGVSKPGFVSDAFVSTVDILPTILDACGLEVPQHVQGRSLRAVAAGDSSGWRTTLAGEYHQHAGPPFFPRRALRDERYKIIHNLLAGELTIDVRIDGDTAGDVAETAAYRNSPAQLAIARQADPPEWELYDLDADPWEFRNLASDPAHHCTLKRMQSLLLQWRQETNDPYLDSLTLAAKHREVN